jgi:hypothetical protein
LGKLRELGLVALGDLLYALQHNTVNRGDVATSMKLNAQVDQINMGTTCEKSLSSSQKIDSMAQR